MNKQLQARRQEVSVKVKEIKQRQQNWLKQRAAAGREPETSNNNDVSKCSNRQRAEKAPKASSSQSESSVHNLIASNKSAAKFQNWLKAKDDHGTDLHESATNDNKYVASNHHDNHVYDGSNYGNSSGHGNEYTNNNYKDRPYRDHSGSDEVNVLRVPSARTPQYATPDPGWNSDDSTGEITAAELMAPQDFDAVADDIIAKVKGELRVSATYNKPEVNYERNVKNRNVKTKTRSSSKYSHSDDDNNYGDSGSPEMSSHSCPGCRRLMMPPSHPAMLLIPCGHTLCSSCCGSLKYCPLCGSRIESRVPNTALQRVITDFHNKANRRDGGGVDAGAGRNLTESYVEEYANLETRCDVLCEEADTINENIQSLTRQLGREKQQVFSITAEEESIQRRITELQEKKQAIGRHRLEYENNCESLQNQTKAETKRLLLVRDTLQSLHGQMEKIKLLAESDE